jgi:hypothetical protein
VGKLVFLLCALTSFACTGMLLRAWLRSRARLLLWSALCFAGLTANNVLLVLDRLVFTSVDLTTWRLGLGLLAVLLLVTGLVLEDER